MSVPTNLPKYYTPLSNEFTVGALVEKYKPFNLKWDTIELSDDDFRSDLKQDNEFTSFIQRPDMYRIKILNKEDIESLNYKYKKEYKSKTFTYPIELYVNKDNNWAISRYSGSLFIRVHTVNPKVLNKLKYIDAVGDTLFMGNVRNITELKHVLSTFS